MIKDSDKTKELLLAELTELRKKSKEQEDKLKAANQQLDASTIELRKNLIYTLENMSDGFVSLDENWHYTYVNKKVGEMFGRKPEDLVGKHIWTEFPEGIGQPFYKNYYKAVETQKEIHFEDYYSPWNRWFENRVIPSKKGLSIFFQDITERKQEEEALKESELKFQKIIYKSFAGISVVDEEGKIIVWNTALEKITGIKSTETVDRYIWDVQAELVDKVESNSKRKDEIRSSLLNVLKTGNAPWLNKAMERDYIHPDGTVKKVSGRMYTIKTQKGYFVVSVSNDITDIKLTEQKLKESEELFSKAFRSSPIAITITDQKTGKYIQVNREWSSIYEYTKEEAIGKTAVELQIVDETTRLQIIDELKIKGTLQNVEMQLRNKSGSYNWILYSTESIVLGGESCVLSTGIDITDRKKAEFKLLESDKNFNDIVDNLMDGVAITNENAYHIYVNSRFSEITGYSKDELLNMTGWDFTRPKDRAELKQRMKDRLAGKPIPMSYDRIIIRKDGTEVSVEMSTTTTIWHGKKCPMAIIHDITERKQSEKALKEAQSNLRALLDNRKDSIWSLDRNYNYLVYNKPYADVISSNMGIRLEKGMNALDIHPKEVADFWKPKFDEVFEGKYVTFEFSHVLEGKEHFFEVLMNPIYTDNKVSGLSALSMDITERKQAEEKIKIANQQLQATEQQLRAANQQLEAINKELIGKEQLLSSIFNTVGDALFLIDVEVESKFRFKYINKAFSDDTGLSKGDIEGKLIEEVIPEPSIHIIKENYLKSIKEKKLITWEEISEYPAGVKIGIVSIVPIIDEKGNCRRLVGSVHDITERKKFELSILESEASLKRAEEVAGFGNWVFDFNNNIFESSGGARKIYGLEEKQYSIDEIQQIPIKSHRNLLDKELSQLINGTKEYNIEFEIKRISDNKRRLIHSIAEYDKDSNRVFGVIHDITEERELERKLLEIEKREKELVQTELEKTKDSLVRTTRLAAVGQVSATIAHELRNPLGAVRNAAFYLKRKSNQEEKTLKYFNIIDNEISTADHIISNMMQMTKIKVPQKEECMLEELIDSASGSHYKDLNIEIETKILNGKGELFCDSVQILQVFRNLLENANQSSENTTKVIIQYDRKSDFTEIIFCDNGSGISEDVKHTIFEPLFTTKAKGTGLGLTICKQIIEKHGGHIEIMDKKNAGACFRIELPVK